MSAAQLADTPTVDNKTTWACSFFLDNYGRLGRLVSMNAAQTNCKCFNATSCVTRRAKGLVPFCEMETTPVSATSDGTFASMEDARIAYPGRKVGKVSGGLYAGSPAQFGLTWSEYAR